jgi:hypothetical protein
MLPTRPAVTTRSRSPSGLGSASGARGVEERSRIDLAVGSRWIVVDDLLYEPLEYHRTLRRSCRTMVSTAADTTRPTRPSREAFDEGVHAMRTAVENDPFLEWEDVTPDVYLFEDV